MELAVTFPGADAPFEGDLALELGALPAGARVTASTLTLRPVAGPGQMPFTEQLSLPNGTGDHGATKAASSSGGSFFIEVDFHTRRTLVSVTGTGLSGGTLQVDFGGLFVPVGAQGEVPAGANSAYSIPADGTLPGLLVSRFRLVTTAAATLSAVTVRSAPSMLSARLGLRPPLWTRIGELTEAVTTPDFAQMLAVAVTEATVQDGALRVPLVVHSDTLCRLDITWRISYVREVSGLPDGVPDVRQSFDTNGLALEATPAIHVALPPAAQVVATAGRIRGAFGSSRVMLGPVGSITEVNEVPVGSGRAQAQPLTTAHDLSAEAVDLLLTPGAGGASLTLQVVEDVDGRPWNVPLLPRPAEMRLDPPKTLAATWVSVPFGARFRFAAGRRYWLVLQAVDGTTGWQVEPVPAPDTGSAAASTADYRPGLQWSGDGGLSWRTATAGAAQPPLRALFRLRAVPAAFEMPALLSVGTPARVEVVGARAAGEAPDTVVPLERLRASARLDADLDLPELAGAIRTWVQRAGGRVCPAAEHLANRDFAIWLEIGNHRRQPEDWELTSGSVSPVIRTTGAWLGDEAQRTALSQVTAAAGGCRYLLEVRTPGAKDATAELIWLARNCAAPRVDLLQLEPLDEEVQFEAAAARISHPYRLTVNAPLDATQVEVRLQTPSNVSLRAERVSLQGSDDIAVNPDLREITTSGLTGWTVTPAGAQPVVAAVGDDVLLGNTGTVPVTLTQPLPVRPGLPYELVVAARGLVTDPAADMPRVTLTWRASGGVPPGPEFVLTARDFGEHRAEGRVPTETSEAELSVRVPATEKALLWERFSLRQPAEVAAPVHVTAQASGEVRVSGAAVQYDVPVPVAPSLPATGPCPATPPDVIPGTRPQDSGHCPCCGTERAVTHARAAVTGVGRPATVGRCATCGTAIIRTGWAAGTVTGPDAGPRDLAQVGLPRVRPAVVLEPEPVDDAPVNAVRGVGRVRARQLAAADIGTVSELLAASPGELAAAVGISKTLIATLLTEAGELRALGTPIRWVVPGQGGAPETRVAAVAGVNADGTPWRLPLGEAVARVMTGTWSFHVVRRDGTRVPLLAAHGVHGPYLKTADDGEQPESLLALPVLPHLSSAPVSRPVPPTPGRG